MGFRQIFVAIIAAMLLSHSSAQLPAWSSSIYAPNASAGSQFGAANTFTGKNSLAIDPLGNSYLVGQLFNGGMPEGFLVKFDSLGNELWQRVILNQRNTWYGADPRSVMVDPDGNVWVAATLAVFEPFSATTTNRCVVVKYTPSGEEIARYLPPLPAQPEPWTGSTCRRMLIDVEGNVVVSGQVTLRVIAPTTTTRSAGFIAKLSRLGQWKWQLAIAGTQGADQYAGAMNSDANGDIYATYATLVAPSAWNTVVIKHRASDGAQMWRSSFVTPSSPPDLRAVVLAANNGAIAVLGAEGNSDATAKLGTIRLLATNTGSLIRKLEFGDIGTASVPKISSINDGLFDQDNNLFVTGTIARADNDLLVAKLSSSGNIVWSSTESLPNTDDHGLAISFSRNREKVLVAGFTDALRAPYSGTSASNYRLVSALTSNGVIDRSVELDGIDRAFDRALALAVTANGSVHVAGNSTQNGRRIAGLVRYTPNFEQEWFRAFALDHVSVTSPGNTYAELSRAFTSDAAGNSILAYLPSNGGDRSTWVEKRGSDGSLLWQHAIAWDQQNATSPAQVKYATNGDVLLAATRTRPSVSGVSHVVYRLDGQTGALIWSNEFARAENQSYAISMSITAEGHLLFAGTLRGIEDTNRQVAAIKLSGETGVTLWELNRSILTAEHENATVATSVGSTIYIAIQLSRYEPPANSQIRRGYQLHRLQDGVSPELIWQRTGGTSSSSQYFQRVNLSVFGIHVLPQSGQVQVSGFVHDDDVGNVSVWFDRFRVEAESTAAVSKVPISFSVKTNRNIFGLAENLDGQGNTYTVAYGLGPNAIRRTLLLVQDSQLNEVCRWSMSGVAGAPISAMYAVAANRDGAIVVGDHVMSDGSTQAAMVQFDKRCKPIWSVARGAPHSNDNIYGVHAVNTGALAGRVLTLGYGSEPGRLRTARLMAFDRADCSLDVDRDGKSLPTTDGQLLLRAMLWQGDREFSIHGVSNPASNQDAETTGNLAITFVRRMDLDLDGDGNVRADTDGLILLRVLLGFTGDSVTSEISFAENATRRQWIAPESATATNSIQLYLQDSCGS